MTIHYQVEIEQGHQRPVDETCMQQTDKFQAEDDKLRVELFTVVDKENNYSDELELTLLHVAQLQEELEKCYIQNKTLETQHIADMVKAE